MQPQSGNNPNIPLTGEYGYINVVCPHNIILISKMGFNKAPMEEYLDNSGFLFQGLKKEESVKTSNPLKRINSNFSNLSQIMNSTEAQCSSFIHIVAP